MAYTDPEDQRAYAREHYQRNRSLYLARAHRHNKTAMEDKREYVQQLKANTPCADCGKQFHFAAMDFDHVDQTKVDSIAGLLRNRVGWKKLREEIAKCEIVCSNCHRIRTYERYHAAVSQLVEDPASNTGQCQFKSDQRY